MSECEDEEDDEAHEVEAVEVLQEVGPEMWIGLAGYARRRAGKAGGEQVSECPSHRGCFLTFSGDN